MPSRVLSLRVTEEEAVEIERRAAHLGLTVSDYLRQRVWPAATNLDTTFTCGPAAVVTWNWKAA